MQIVFVGGALILPGDAAVVEAKENRKDLPCVVRPVAPEIGFDLQFHAGYTVQVPVRNLEEGQQKLRILFRVIPLDRKDQPVYFSGRYPVQAVIDGSFTVAEGRHHVDWLMRDRAERVCSAHWDLTTKKLDRPLQPAGRFHVQILLHASGDLSALLSMLRGVSEDPRIGRRSLVAFNAQQRRVLFRQEDVAHLDFSALRDSLEKLNLTLVDYHHLQEKDGEGRFLAELAREALARDCDAVLFLGPKIASSLPDGWKQGMRCDRPVFFLNYDRDPQANPWRDAITVIVKSLRGRVYTISRPVDLSAAWRDIMARLGSE